MLKSLRNLLPLKQVLVEGMLLAHRVDSMYPLYVRLLMEIFGILCVLEIDDSNFCIKRGTEKTCQELCKYELKEECFRTKLISFGFKRFLTLNTLAFEQCLYTYVIRLLINF